MSLYQQYQVSQQQVSERIIVNNATEHPQIILSVSPCRSGSSVMLRVFSAVGISSYYQPLKTILRWKLVGADASWQVPQNTGVPIYVKETLGPYTKAEATFNPLSVLLNVGLPPENLHLLILGRDPLHTWASWLTYVKGKTTVDKFISAYVTTENIRKQAIADGIQVTTMTYELFRDYEPEIVIRNLFQRFDLEYRQIAIDGWDKLPPYGTTESNIYVAEEHPLFDRPEAVVIAFTSKNLAYVSHNHRINALSDTDVEKITNNDLFNIHKYWMDDAKSCLSL